MNSIPFKSVEEAKDNARLLCRTLAFYEVKWPDGSEIGLQQTQNIVAQVLGCFGWVDLVERINLGRATAYLDQLEDPGSVRKVLAERFGKLVGGTVQSRNIYAAIISAAFGCSPSARNAEKRIMANYPCRTITQFQELQNIDHAFSYHARYLRGRTVHDIEMLVYARDKAKAEVLGIPVPRKPSIRKEPVLQRKAPGA